MAWTERYVRADADGSGDGTTDTNTGATGAWTIAQALTVTTGAQPGHRVNVKAGAYSMGTSVTATATAGTAASPIWWRGYNTTIGDLDSDHATARPVFTWTSGRFDASHGYQVFSSMDFAGSSGVNALLRMLAVNLTLRRCSVENTATSSGSSCVLTNSNNCNLLDCSFDCGSTATYCVTMLSAWLMMRCRISGGISGLSLGNNSPQVAGCVISNTVTNGILVGSGVLAIKDCIFYDTGDYGINNTAASSGLLISGNVFSTTGTAIAYTGAGDRPYGAYRSDNAFHSITTAQESGFGDMPAFDPITLTADPFTNAASGDFSLNDTAGGGAVLKAATLVVGSTTTRPFRNLDNSAGGGSTVIVVED